MKFYATHTLIDTYYNSVEYKTREKGKKDRKIQMNK